jgi:beta-lactamase class A
MRSRFLRVASVALFALACTVPARAAAQDAHREILRQKLQAELKEVAEAFDGVAGIHVTDLTDGDHFDVNGDLVFPQASAIRS